MQNVRFTKDAPEDKKSKFLTTANKLNALAPASPDSISIVCSRNFNTSGYVSYIAFSAFDLEAQRVCDKYLIVVSVSVFFAMQIDLAKKIGELFLQLLGHCYGYLLKNENWNNIKHTALVEK